MSEIIKVSTVNATEKKEDTDMLLGSIATAVEKKEDKAMLLGNNAVVEKKEDKDMLLGNNATAVNGLPVGIRNISLEDYLSDIRHKHLSTDVAIQRGDDQWKSFQKERLIDSVLRKRPMPPIFTAIFNDTEVVYDGLQRTTALMEYQDNKFAVNEKYYKDLTDEERKSFNEYEIHIDNAGTVMGDELAELFINLNNGTALAKAQKLKGFAGYDNAAWINTMCKSDLMTRLAAFTDMQKKNDAALECLIQGMIITDVFLGEGGDETFDWKNISRDEQIRYSNEVLSHKSPEDLKKYQEALEFASKISGSPEYKKTMVPAIIFLSRVAIIAGLTVKEFDKYVSDLEHNKPDAYKKNMGSGNVSKKSTVGRIEALFKDFKEKYPNKVTMDVDFEAKSKRTTNARKSAKSKVESVPAVKETTASTEIESSTSISEEATATISKETITEVSAKAEVSDTAEVIESNNEAVDSETSTEVEVSDTTEATETTSGVETSDIFNNNGVSQSAEAPADASSDTSETTVEDSASDSPEADAEPANDVSDGTEVVA